MNAVRMHRHASAHSRLSSSALAGLLTLSLLAAAPGRAADALIRASLSGEDQVWVGQQVTLVVELLAPGYFASAASFDLPDPEGVLLMPPTGNPVIGSETIEGTEYSVQRHELTVWPMRPGNQSVPALTIRFTFKRHPLDRDTVPVSVSTAAIPFTVSTPPGAEHLGTVISARSLEVDDVWRPEPGTENIPAGSAFTRIITFTAPEVPGMIFPPFPAMQMDGLRIYRKHQLLDQENRGALTGKRQETVTYVCQRPGTFTIPAVTFTWFDLDAARLRTETLATRTLTVIANPDMTAADRAATARERSPFRDWTWLDAAALLAAIGMAVLIFAMVRSAGTRRWLRKIVLPLRPVRLVPLNPTDRPGP